MFCIADGAARQPAALQLERLRVQPHALQSPSYYIVTVTIILHGCNHTHGIPDLQSPDIAASYYIVVIVIVLHCYNHILGIPDLQITIILYRYNRITLHHITSLIVLHCYNHTLGIPDSAAYIYSAAYKYTAGHVEIVIIFSPL